MRSSVFGKWVLSHPFKAHIVLPGLLSVVLVAMYFSTVPTLQNLVAPGSGSAGAFALAGRGALELLQVVLLLCIFFFIVRSLMASREWPVRIWALLLLLGAAAVFMEEVDFGSSLISVFSGQGLPTAAPSWEGVPAAGAPLAPETLAAYVKLAGSVLVGLFFVLAPVMLAHSRNRTLRTVAPSPWTIATVMLAIVLGQLVRFLQGANLGTIKGVQGPLVYDLAEFRELLVYYLVLVYVASLHERVIVRQ